MSAGHFLGTTPLYPRSQYAGIVRDDLPAYVFAHARSRLWFLPLYVAIAAAAIVAIASGRVPWEAWPLLSIVIGLAFAGMMFVTHELLHGGIVAGKARQHALGWLGFAPFVLSPRLWMAWHNRSHHAETNLPDDPDGYPTLASYRARGAVRFSIDKFSLGGRRWRGGLSLVLGFTVQSFEQLRLARDKGFLDARAHRLAIAETALAAALWLALAVAIGPVAFLFAFALPVLVANVCVMTFILTNHSLSPRLTLNDPLVGGLSVTTPRWLECATLGFGFHVEHHLFPAMSTRHASAVRAQLQSRWPERYQSMPLAAALRLLHRTARVYKDATTLLDPMTGAEFPTLLPGPTPRTA